MCGNYSFQQGNTNDMEEQLTKKNQSSIVSSKNEEDQHEYHDTELVLSTQLDDESREMVLEWMTRRAEAANKRFEDIVEGTHKAVTNITNKRTHNESVLLPGVQPPPTTTTVTLMERSCCIVL